MNKQISIKWIKENNNGGVREGAGRPKKADELKLIEKLDNLIDNDEVIKTLGKQIFKGDIKGNVIVLWLQIWQAKRKCRYNINRWIQY